MNVVKIKHAAKHIFLQANKSSVVVEAEKYHRQKLYIKAAYLRDEA